MSDITPEKVRALLDAATPGPWCSTWVEPMPGCAKLVEAVDFGPVIYSAADIDPSDALVVFGFWHDEPLTACREYDAALIAAAPAIATAYLAVVEERDMLHACRLGYASEFPRATKVDRAVNVLPGDLDVGNIHTNIRALKAERDALAARVAELERALANASEQERQRCARVAVGCKDMMGGYSGENLEAFWHGMDTVANALRDDPGRYSVRVLESIGALEDPDAD